MAMIVSLCGPGVATFRAFQTRSKWWLEIVKGDNRVSLPLSLEEWISLREAAQVPGYDIDHKFQALAYRDPTPPADADNVGGPAPCKNDGAPLEIEEGDYLPGTDPLRLPD